MNANHTVDLLIVGSGNGALTAALCAYEFGVRDVLVAFLREHLRRFLGGSLADELRQLRQDLLLRFLGYGRRIDAHADGHNVRAPITKLLLA